MRYVKKFPFQSEIVIIILGIPFGALLGLYFKFKQLTLLEPRVLSLYPKLWWFQSASIGILVTLLFLHFSFCLYRCTKTSFKKKRLRANLFALLFCFFTQSAFNGFLSPLNWDNPTAALHKVESFTQPNTSPLSIGHFQNAKRYDFSNFSHAFWGGEPRGMMNNDSFVIAVATLLFDLPSASAESYHRLLLIVFFFFCVLSSFGFFLFLQKMELSYFVSLIGATLFLLANRAFAVNLTQNFPIFISPFLILPFVLYLLVTAEKEKSWKAAAAAGVVFSLNFYLLGSHPDSILHFTLFITAYFIYSLLVNRFSKDTLIRILAFGCFVFTGAAYYLAPIISSFITKESSHWSHQEGIVFYFGLKEGLQVIIFPLLKVFGLFGLLLFYPLLFPNFKKFKQVDKNTRFFIYFFIALFILLVPGTDGFLCKIIEAFNIKPMQFTRIDRVLVYFYLSTLVMILGFIDIAILKATDRYSKSLAYVALLLSVYVLVRKSGEITPLLIFGGLLLFAVLVYFGRKIVPASNLIMVVAISAVVTSTAISESHFEFKSPKLLNNPNNTRVYFNMRSILTAIKSLPEDKIANLRFLKTRLGNYESDCLSDKKKVSEVYRAFLNSRSITSAADLLPDQVLELANLAGKDIDSFYLTEFSRSDQITNIAKKESWGRTFYSVLGNYNGTDNRFKLIRAATSGDEHQGIGAGLHFMDNTSAIDLRYTQMLPSLNALYLLPNHYFESVGHTTDTNFYQYGVEYAKNKIIRNRMNIAGFNIYSFKLADWNSFSDLEKTDFKIIQQPAGNNDWEQYIIAEDLKSNPALYLADTVGLVDEKSSNLNKYRFPLATEEERLKYKEEVKRLEFHLDAIKEKRTVLLEGKQVGPLSFGKGAAKILNWIGPRMVSEVECRELDCLAVFNTAAVSGWHAFTNQTESKIEKANFAFTATRVPVGSFLLWFEWRPTYLFYSCLITLASYLAILLLINDKSNKNHLM